MPSPTPDGAYYSSSSPYPTVHLIFMLLSFFLLASFLVCICKCFIESLFRHGPLLNRTLNVVVMNSGLEPSAVQSFPTIAYANVKELRQDKHGMECAICLVEFDDDSILRVLTLCYHIFHRECIDVWLRSNKTCPVCRHDLTQLPLEKTLERSPIIARYRDNINSTMASIRESNESPGHAVSIDIREAGEERAEEGRPGSTERAINIRGQGDVERFPRSHSTGHSMPRSINITGTIVEKYTLRFPDHVKFNITGRHTRSSVTFGEISSSDGKSRGVGLDEVSGPSK